MPGPYKDNKLADQIRDYMAAWLVQDFQKNVITVDAVTFSTNRHTAYVWIHAFYDEDNTLPSILKQKTPYYRHKLARELNRRSIPNLEILIG